jgi:hypothetical protein
MSSLIMEATCYSYINALYWRSFGFLIVSIYTTKNKLIMNPPDLRKINYESMKVYALVLLLALTKTKILQHPILAMNP